MRAWSSTTLKVIREATPCISICPTAPTTASADGNAATASGGETMYDRVVTNTHWPAYRKPGATLGDLDVRSERPQLPTATQISAREAARTGNTRSAHQSRSQNLS